MMRTISFLSLAATLLFAPACDRNNTLPSEQTPVTPAVATDATPKSAATAPTPRAQKVETSQATIGQPAPSFSLPDLAGKTHKLADYLGKPIVLEWFNPLCPFVKASHTEGSLISTAVDLEKKGFVYLAINSNAPGKQGHGLEANAAGKEGFGLKHPILLDETGTTGKAYGATNTPHIFLIDENGTLVYAGAIDNSPDGERKSPEGGKLINYLTQAAEELLAKKPISTPKTEAYGCSVKYAD